MAIMGSPDPRQIDGIGGGHLLTSRVADVSRPEHSRADVDYLFLQVQVDKPVVSAEQPCDIYSREPLFAKLRNNSRSAVTRER
ncbi:PrpF domain-containing protein [Actinoplanes sp. NPDC020271]|uniref:PrpF domain-containing protein n=1 Tax=Actinoplanes sp. NPDC020271 TaxID=3363896 RepID=UPI0037B62ADF